MVYDAGVSDRFATRTPGNTNAYLVLQNDGNLVIVRPDGRVVWDRVSASIVALSTSESH